MTEYRELHPIGTAERIEILVRANQRLLAQLHRLRGRKATLRRLKALERENKMLKRQMGLKSMTLEERRAIAAKRLWADPEFREKQGAAFDLRRGFHVPDHLKRDFKWLTRTKRYPAYEAGQILGLV